MRTASAAAVGADFRLDRLEGVTEMIAECASILSSEGLRAGLHNHVSSWVETEQEIDFVLGALGDDVLGASFDIGHLAWAGIDAVSMLRRHSDRIVDLHIKDVAAASRAEPDSYDHTVDAGVFREPGTGDLDLVAILRALPPEFDGWIVIEVDRPTMPPAESARVAHAWVERISPSLR